VAPKEHRVALSVICRVKVDEAFRRLKQAEMPIVASVVAFSEPAPMRTILRLTNFLSDGWIYSVLLFFLLFEKDWRMLLVSLLAVAICFGIYYATKPVLARVRPCHEAITLVAQPRCLDQYSFPSGHCMTLTVLSVLLSWQYHAIAPILLGAVILLCWARMAAAHHYPSDLIGGIGIGLAVGVPIARTLL
jgi:undecaprenyl-diphosphatase